MRLGEAVSLSTAAFEPFGKAWFQNTEAAKASCDFGSVLEYFEHLPPIPRTCLAPLAKLATKHCSDFLEIEDVTSYTATVTPQVTEVAVELVTTLATTTVYETVTAKKTADVFEVDTKTTTSTKTTTYTIFPPKTTIHRIITITQDPVTLTMTTHVPAAQVSGSDTGDSVDLDGKGTPDINLPLIDSPFGNLHRQNHQPLLPQRNIPVHSPPPPPPRPSGHGNSDPPRPPKTWAPPACNLLAKQILSLSHPSAILSEACACLAIKPRTISTAYYPPASLSIEYPPTTITWTHTSTITNILSITSTLLDLRINSVTSRQTTTKVLTAPLATTTFELCKHAGYKGSRQNGVGNRVETIPEDQVGSQDECCKWCVNTPNCVALAWIGTGQPEQPDADQEEGPVRKNRKERKVCQLLIKEKPLGLSYAGGGVEEVLRSSRRARKGGLASTAMVQSVGVEKKVETNGMCPLGVEEYDFGEESVDGEGVVFRGPCGVPKDEL